jgi:hypothetical protein
VTLSPGGAIVVERKATDLNASRGTSAACATTWLRLDEIEGAPKRLAGP